ncbi:NAD(P)-dependent oxidoreductase [Rhodococcus sp. NPDC127530]|uniref:NAD(P)-dependent oxidoreductase n=1 Tax=unclassified Rhodococcus (in: high G+C Gram-positive bacteria) TaxID=192944 RepID=UPI003637B39D
MIESVAVLGVGVMGAPMARRLAAAGYALSVCDRSPEALASFDGDATTVTTDPRECASVDLVIVLVATIEQAVEVTVGSGGVLGGKFGDRPPRIMIMSTVGPQNIERLRREIGDRGSSLVDAPISGGVTGAESGTLSIFVGGDDADVDLVEPVLKHLGTNIFRCGDVGDAQTVKLVNNALGVLNAYVGAEAFRLAVERGLDPGHVARVLEVSSGRNLLTATSVDVTTIYAGWTASRSDFDGLTSLMHKDLGLVADLTAEARESFPLLGQLPRIIGALGDETFRTWQTVAGRT